LLQHQGAFEFVLVHRQLSEILAALGLVR
jgi:hypothetical protein